MASQLCTSLLTQPPEGDAQSSTERHPPPHPPRIQPDQALLDAQLDWHNKYPLHALLQAAGLELTEAKKPSRFYARFHGASALEVAVALGHPAVAAALRAAGAGVRPQAFDALLLYCPSHARDGMSALLAGSQASMCWWAGTS